MKAKWNHELVILEALKYKTKNEFCLGSNGAYDYARRKGMLSEITKHMPKAAYGGVIKWTEKAIRAEALNYSHRGVFLKNCSGASNAAKKLGIFESVCSHMSESLTARYLEGELEIIALKYKTRKEFAVKAAGAWVTARKRGILDQVCAHMPKNNSAASSKARAKWQEKEVTEEALKYSHRGQFAIANAAAYEAAIRDGILDKVCSHMTILSRGAYSYEEIKEIALLHKTKSEFVKNNLGAYKAALRLNILDDVCSHMPMKGVVSTAEVELRNIIKQLYSGVKTLRVRSKTLIPGKPYIKGFDIDMYVPELKKGVEFDGIYWHSVEGLKRSRKTWPEAELVNYHKTKDAYFEGVGIDILHINEAEWNKDKNECIVRCLDFLKGENNE